MAVVQQTAVESHCRLAMRHGLDSRALTDLYSTIAQSGEYDKYLGEDSYNGPLQTAQVFTALWEEEMCRDEAMILDVGAGTGTCGKHMKNFGFKQLVSLEPSAGMTEVAKKRAIYSEFFSDFLGTNECTIPDDMFDGIVSSGAFGPSHIPVTGLFDMVRLCKPGALVCIGMRAAYLDEVEGYRIHWKPTLKRLQDHGYINMICEQDTVNWCEDRAGIVFAFTILKKGSLPY